MASEFTHLHVHSHFSLLAGTASVVDLAARAAADGLQRLALTDTHALYGVVRFSRACQAVNIQPITGMMVMVPLPKDWDDAQRSAPQGRLVLLAKDHNGYRSLCRLSSCLQGHADREERLKQGFSWDLLSEHRDGLICLSGGRSGWIERYLRQDQERKAYDFAGRLAGIFSEDFCLSLEIQSSADIPVLQASQTIGKRLGIPTVAVHPIYSLEPQHAPRTRLLAAIDRNCPLSQVPTSALPNGGDPSVDLHWLSPEEMAVRYAEFPEALAMTGAIARRCGPCLPDGRPIWPALQLPSNMQAEEALRVQAHDGLPTRFGEAPPAQVSERLQSELAVLTESGYAPLFLVVADIVRFARRAQIPVSTRGSVANCLVAYCMGITDVDPVDHDLLFERFLNPARKDLPDIDLDFCSRRRDEVLAYVRKTYGKGHVALVSTISTLRPRGALRETAKAYELPDDLIDDLIGLLPRGFRQRLDVDQLLEQVGDPHVKRVVQVAMDLVGQPHHLSVHPGGVVITPGPLTDTVPLQWAPKGFLITQFDHTDVGAIGLPKLDLLGIRALTVLADAVELVRGGHAPEFNLESIPMEDPKTQALLMRGETLGVFQCESLGAQRTLRRLQARTLRDMAIANAFFRPGPSTGGMARSFERRYRGEEAVEYLHPSLEPILGFTSGVLIFQEQVLRIAREVAGLSWEQADRIRRGMSTHVVEDISNVEAEFIRGCMHPEPDGPGMTQRQAKSLWEQVAAFSGFGFNQGHATAYAAVSYRSAYMKAHWPAEFLCARLAARGGYHHPAIYMAEARRLGIPIHPPHINHSRRRFTLVREGEAGEGAGGLWMGLDQVRDLRRDTIRAIIAARGGAPFSGLTDLVSRVDLSQKELEHLVMCGALEGFGEIREALLARVQSRSRPGGLRQMALPFSVEQEVAEDPAQRMRWEHRVLGLPVSVHPLQVVEDRFPPHLPLRELEQHAGNGVSIVGVRLPGWTGLGGFWLGDEEHFIVVQESGQTRWPVWKPLHLRGRWQGDGMGSYWFQAGRIEELR